MLFACVVIQDFMALADVYNSTLHILDDNTPIYSVVGSQNVFQLWLPENRQYKAYVQFIFHYVCHTVDVNTSSFYLSESYCLLVAQLPTEVRVVYMHVRHCTLLCRNI